MTKRENKYKLLQKWAKGNLFAIDFVASNFVTGSDTGIAKVKVSINGVLTITLPKP